MLTSEVPHAEVSARRQQPSDAAAERQLFLRWQQFSDRRARNELVSRYLPLAKSLARRFRNRRDAPDDLVQVASIGLLHAIDRFDVDRGFAFTSFATPTIVGELMRHRRDLGWPLHVPRRIREDSVRVARAARGLEGRLGRCPATSELAEACAMSCEEVLGALEAQCAASPGSLDWESDAEGGPPPYERWLGVEDDGFEAVEVRDGVGRRLRSCDEREQTILRLRLVENRSQQEIAERVGLSQMHVSRLLRRLMSEALEAS